MRSTLVAALLSYADDRRRAIARRFLQGLSSDELLYIADFLGACILEPDHAAASRAQMAARVSDFQRGRGSRETRDADHKMILVLEYLCRCEVHFEPAAVRVRAAGA